MTQGLLEAPPKRGPVTDRPNGPVGPPPPPTGGGDGPDREPSPRRPVLDNIQLAVLFLIGGEVMFFAALIAALFVTRLGQPLWPPPHQPRLPVGVTGVNTLVLASRGHFGQGRTAPVRACAMFWHFVVGLWPLLYVTVYLL